MISKFLKSLLFSLHIFQALQVCALDTISLTPFPLSFLCMLDILLIFEWKPTMEICDDANNMKTVFFEKAWGDTIV